MKTMKSISASLLLLFLFVVFSSVSHAEENNNNDNNDHSGYNSFSFGLHGGGLTGFTDVKENNFFPDSDEITYGGGVFFNYHWSPVLTLQTNFLYGELKGIDTDKNWDFETEIFEATLNARLSLNALLRPHGTANQKVNFYATLGAGAIAYRSQLYEDGNLINFYGYEADGVTSDDPEIELTIPFGLGINFKISERFDIGLESGFRFTSSNRLDGRPIIASERDKFNYTRIGLTFRLGRNTNSMDWAPPSEVMYPGDVARIEGLEKRLDTMEAGMDDLHTTHQQDVDTLQVQLDDMVEFHITYQEDIDAIQVQMDGMSEEIAELSQHTVQMFENMEEIAGEQSRLQTEIEKIKERPDQFYSVQVMALQDKLEADKARHYLGITHEVSVYHINAWYKYISGKFNNLEDAILHMQRIWGQGVRDAFVVEYRDGMLYPR